MASLDSKNLPDDALHRSYVTSGDRGALGELVRRYAGLVYAAARRQVRDADLAEDVMQNVFVTFARRAREIRSAAAVGPWLLQTTRFTSANAMKTEHRRRAHEQIARLSRSELAENADPAASAIAAEEGRQWEAVCPLLDEAISHLGQADQTAVVLRFLRGLSLRDVALATGTTEEGARKRVTRAIARLRKRLAGAGAPPAACGAAALTAMLAGRAVEAAPPAALAHATSAAVAAASTAPVLGGSILHGVIAMSTGTKIAVAAGLLVLMSVGTVGVIQMAGISISSPGLVLAAPPAQGAPPTQSAVDAVTFVNRTPTATPAGWEAAFNATYSLADGQIVKFVPAPFIPERADFIKTTTRRLGQFAGRVPDQLIIAQQPDGMLKSRSTNFGGGAGGFGRQSGGSSGTSTGGAGAFTFTGTTGVAFEIIVEKLANLRPWQIDGGVQLLSTPLQGDWVVREGATQDQILASMSDFLANQIGKKLTFTHSQVQKDVIAIQGKPKTTVKSNGGSSMRMSSDAQGMSVEGAGTVDNMANTLSQILGIPIVNESQASATDTLSYHMEIPADSGKLSAQRMAEPLAALASETGLTFHAEQRKMDLWTLTPVP